jgi:hypothetical protein
MGLVNRILLHAFSVVMMGFESSMEQPPYAQHFRNLRQDVLPNPFVMHFRKCTLQLCSNFRMLIMSELS